VGAPVVAPVDYIVHAVSSAKALVHIALIIVMYSLRSIIRVLV
jgi:hypothetical protein